MTDHQEGDRIEFDTLDQDQSSRGVIEHIHRSPGRRPVVLEYVIRCDSGYRYHLPPQHCYPERTTT